jgi:membrane protease YdiL (CAAX protease family)
MEMLALVVAAAILSGCLMGWARTIRKWSIGQLLIPWSSRREVPWAFIDLIGLAAIFIAANLAIWAGLAYFGWLPSSTALKDLTLSQRGVLTLATAVLSCLVLLIGLPLVALRCGANARDFGWSANDFVGDLKLGLAAFVMLAPPVYVLQAVLTQIWPSEHPLVELFKAGPDVRLFGMLALAAAIVAPIFEELMFRVVLQGFLEKAVSFRGSVFELVFGGSHPEPDTLYAVNQAAPEAVESAVQTLNPGPTNINPYAPPVEAKVLEDGSVARGSAEVESIPLRGWRAWLPIGISAIIFALLHFEHGPDWIPLFFLAVGMGYLYQRTHRVVPSLVVHVSLNSLSLWWLWILVYRNRG